MNFKQIVGTVAIAVLLSPQALAKSQSKDQYLVAIPDLQGTYVSFNAKALSGKGMVTIAGPNGYYVRKVSDDGIPSVSLTEHGKLVDGDYNYEIVMAIGPMTLFKDTMNNGRGEDDSVYARKGVRQSGHFKVVNGEIKRFIQMKEPEYSVFTSEW